MRTIHEKWENFGQVRLTFNWHQIHVNWLAKRRSLEETQGQHQSVGIGSLVVEIDKIGLFSDRINGVNRYRLTCVCVWFTTTQRANWYIDDILLILSFSPKNTKRSVSKLASFKKITKALLGQKKLYYVQFIGFYVSAGNSVLCKVPNVLLSQNCQYKETINAVCCCVLSIIINPQRFRRMTVVSGLTDQGHALQ